jgi:hypothetical protein
MFRMKRIPGLWNPRAHDLTTPFSEGQKRNLI